MSDSPPSSEAIRQAKKALRARLKEAVAALSPTEKARASQAICQRILNYRHWPKAGSMLAYMPRRDEPDIREVLQNALESGRTVALPAYHPSSKDYEARQVGDLEGDLVPGQYGILEPGPDCPLIPLNQLDFALIPGVGFSSSGCRLGRGNGYYDRILSQTTGYRCGLAFDCQMVDAIPSEPHDIRMHGIMSESQWWDGQAV